MDSNDYVLLAQRAIAGLARGPGDPSAKRRALYDLMDFIKNQLNTIPAPSYTDSLRAAILNGPQTAQERPEG